MIQRYSSLCFFIFFLFACDKSQKPQNTEGGQGTVSAQADFTKRFPKAQDTVWDTLDTGLSVTFFDDESEKNAFFDEKGQFQYAITFISDTELPKSVQKTLDDTYHDAIASVIMRVENAQTMTYQIEMETSSEHINIEFDASGKLLKEKREPLSNEELKRQEQEGVEPHDK